MKISGVSSLFSSIKQTFPRAINFNAASVFYLRSSSDAMKCTCFLLHRMKFAITLHKHFPLAKQCAIIDIVQRNASFYPMEIFICSIKNIYTVPTFRRFAFRALFKLSINECFLCANEPRTLLFCLCGTVVGVLCDGTKKK